MKKELWTINLKSFEINESFEKGKTIEMNYKLEKFWNTYELLNENALDKMNYKLEKFWNFCYCKDKSFYWTMNYKLEKFWNKIILEEIQADNIWTINLKSFEITW